MPHIPTGDPDVYEVFTQSGHGTALSHVGSVVSPRPDSAWHLAKEAYGRRDDLANLWVARRSDLIVSSPEDRDLLAAKTRMPHRQPGFPTARRRDRGAAPPAVAGSPERHDDVLVERHDDAPATGESELHDLWLALADDLFVLGNRLGERIVDYIDLEEALAVGSIGQEAVAHAGTILLLCGFDQLAVDAWFFDRAQSRWQVSSAVERIDDWPSIVACGLVIAAAVTVLAEETARVEPGAAALPAVTAIHAEQLVHLDHWRRLAQALTAWPETRAEFAHAYAGVTGCAGDLFGALPQGILPGELPAGPAPAASLHERLAALVAVHGGPASRLPDHPLPRKAGNGGSTLAGSLARGRSVRAGYAPGVFS